MKHHLFISLLTLVLSSPCFAHSISPELYDQKDLTELKLIDRGDGSQPTWMTLPEAMSRYSEKSHQAGRCAGFFDITYFQDAPRFSTPLLESFSLNLKERTFSQGAYLEQALIELKTQNLSNTVQKLSNFKNRYYKSKYGIEAVKWIASEFTAIAKNRSDIKVELFEHKQWAQPSVIATIQGQGPHKNEIVVVGGHADSINQSAFGSKEMVAPGADDNASGISTVLEIFRVLVETGFKPDRTLQFMGYAAEEVGLLGSQDIANQYRKNNQAVTAVMQLDMTAFPGAGDQVVFMTDFTNADLTLFTQKLMDTYVKARWSNDKCGYACSDHASWTKAGYSSVMPFEATMNGDNKDIHTKRDLIGKLNFDHGLMFAKLGLSFMAELSK